MTEPLPQPSGWVRLLARAPFGVLYPIASLLAFIAFHIVRYKRAMMDASIAIAFPELDASARARIARDHLRNYAQVMMEILKSGSLTPQTIVAHTSFADLAPLRERLARGKPVIVTAAHHCNWDWLLYALVAQAGVPVDAAYKPIKNAWANRQLMGVRLRFGPRLVKAPDLLTDIIKHRAIVRAITILADQEPRHSERRYWTRFLNRDTAFYLGLEDIARATGYPVLFASVRRIARGRYAAEFTPLLEAGEKLPPGEFTERYARLTEAQARVSPADWLWTYNRWRLKKPLYAPSLPDK
jgi:KDO2-lipid IV(A) lauroyltransferase